MRAQAACEALPFDGGPLFAHAIEIHQPTPGVRGMWESLLPTI